MDNPFKTSGPEVYYDYGYVQCCRVWPIILRSYTWNQSEDRWIGESWGWRRCGLCGEIPHFTLGE